jgi:tripartite-type tricarboxylate transporter receptor subunit TctC
MKRRTFAIAAACSALPVSWRAALAADAYPARPVLAIVPYAVGGADTYLRPLQPALEQAHGIRLVIESVNGAGGTVGASRVKRSTPDGYTLLFCGSGLMSIAPRVQPAAPVLADFIPIINLVTVPYIIATRKGSPITDLPALIDFIKRRPGVLTYGSPGISTSPHLGMESLARMLGSSVTHIPYSGIATAIQGLLGGHLEAVIGAPSTLMPQIEAKAIQGIALVGKNRFPLAPDIPSLAEAGIDLDVSTHFAVYAPRGTPAEVVATLARAFQEAASDPSYTKAMEGVRTRVNLMPADVLARTLADETSRFGAMMSAITT